MNLARIRKHLRASCALALCLATLGVSGHAQAQDRKVRLQMASSYGASLPLLGESGVAFAKKVSRVSGGSIDIRFNEPNALVPVLQTFDAVSQGSVDAAWTASAFWAGKDSAFSLFSTVPFGPAAPEFLAWFRQGGGRQLMEALYHEHGIHPLNCAIIPPEGAGWFRKEIQSLDELKGMKMRFLGLGARVMEKFGVATQLIAPGEIYQALQLGTIDAAEFSTPDMDFKLGFYQVAKFYYLPGWHQQSTANQFIINKKKWDSLTDTQRALLEQACGDSIADTIGLGEAAQFRALKEMQEKGVQLRKWSPEILAAFEKAWHQVAEEEAAKNPNFRKVFDSYNAFRKDYATWLEYGVLR